MESPFALRGPEEHSGSESGWTFYIGSTAQKENGNNDADIHGDDGSEDSMASDASSGPSHHELPCEKGEESVIMGHIKHAKDEAHGKHSSERKPRKQVKKKDERKVSEEKGQKVHWAETAASCVSTGARVRNSKIMLE